MPPPKISAKELEEARDALGLAGTATAEPMPTTSGGGPPIEMRTVTLPDGQTKTIPYLSLGGGQLSFGSQQPGLGATPPVLGQTATSEAAPLQPSVGGERPETPFSYWDLAPTLLATGVSFFQPEIGAARIASPLLRGAANIALKTIGAGLVGGGARIGVDELVRGESSLERAKDEALAQMLGEIVPPVVGAGAKRLIRPFIGRASAAYADLITLSRMNEALGLPQVFTSEGTKGVLPAIGRGAIAATPAGRMVREYYADRIKDQYSDEMYDLAQDFRTWRGLGEAGAEDVPLYKDLGELAKEVGNSLDPHVFADDIYRPFNEQLRARLAESGGVIRAPEVKVVLWDLYDQLYKAMPKGQTLTENQFINMLGGADKELRGAFSRMFNGQDLNINDIENFFTNITGIANKAPRATRVGLESTKAALIERLTALDAGGEAKALGDAALKEAYDFIRTDPIGGQILKESKFAAPMYEKSMMRAVDTIFKSTPDNIAAFRDHVITRPNGRLIWDSVLYQNARQLFEKSIRVGENGAYEFMPKAFIADVDKILPTLQKLAADDPSMIHYVEKLVGYRDWARMVSSSFEKQKMGQVAATSANLALGGLAAAQSYRSGASPGESAAIGATAIAVPNTIGAALAFSMFNPSERSLLVRFLMRSMKEGAQIGIGAGGLTQMSPLGE